MHQPRVFCRKHRMLFFRLPTSKMNLFNQNYRKFPPARKRFPWTAEATVPSATPTPVASATANRRSHGFWVPRSHSINHNASPIPPALSLPHSASPSPTLIPSTWVSAWAVVAMRVACRQSSTLAPRTVIPKRCRRRRLWTNRDRLQACSTAVTGLFCPTIFSELAPSHHCTTDEQTLITFAIKGPVVFPPPSLSTRPTVYTTIPSRAPQTPIAMPTYATTHLTPILTTKRAERSFSFSPIAPIIRSCPWASKTHATLSQV